MGCRYSVTEPDPIEPPVMVTSPTLSRSSSTSSSLTTHFSSPDIITSFRIQSLIDYVEPTDCSQTV